MKRIIVLLLLLGAMIGSHALAAQQQLHALVIGNSDYEKAQSLANASADASAVADKLRSLGFKVLERHNQTRAGMRQSLRKFHSRLENADNAVALLFYAGHGIQRNGKNYLIPVDADISKEYEIEDSALQLSTVLASLNDVRPQLSVVMLDACRNNPFERRIRGLTRSLNFKGEGLAPVNSVQGTILSFATEPGNVAVDGFDGHSPYTSAILKHIGTPGLSIQDMLNQVGLTVMAATHGEQKPWVSSSPVPRFCFGGCNSAPAVQLASAAPVAVKADTSPESEAIAAIQDAFHKQSLDDIKKYVRLTLEQEALVKNLFEIYPDITMAPTSASRSLVLSGAGKTLDMVVSEAINEEGNRVIPSKKWSRLTFELR